MNKQIKIPAEARSKREDKRDCVSLQREAKREIISSVKITEKLIKEESEKRKKRREEKREKKQRRKKREKEEGKKKRRRKEKKKKEKKERNFFLFSSLFTLFFFFTFFFLSSLLSLFSHLSLFLSSCIKRKKETIDHSDNF